MRILAHWDDVMTTEDTNHVAAQLAAWHLGKVHDASAEAQVLSGFVSAGDYRSLVDYELDHEDLTPHDAYHLRSVLALYSKREDLDVGIDREAVAKGKFDAAEQLCRETNELLRAVRAGKACLRPATESVLFLAQRKIARILGKVPQLSQIRPRFGPGATTNTKKKDACARNKLADGLACSREMEPVARAALSMFPAWLEALSLSLDSCPIPIRDGELCFQPKNAKVFRITVTEPPLNTMYQLGIGDLMAVRLRREGLDIRDQEPNQLLAALGSLTGALATLDLSSASDTIAIELVYELLPLDWAHFLARFRTGTILYRSLPIRLEKFSSMGNGYTFPLETLIFYALAKAAAEVSGTEGTVRAYGDDIIVPTGAYGLLCEVLRDVGFIPNASKSFSTGRFRESCGADYLSGYNVRPAYIRDKLSGESLFTYHNAMVRRGDMDAASLILSSFTTDPKVRIFGPDGYGDGHLLGDWTPKPYKRDFGYEGYTFETYRWKPKRSFALRRCADAALPSYLAYIGEVSPHYQPLSFERPVEGPLVSERSRNSFLRRKTRGGLRKFAEDHVVTRPSASYDPKDPKDPEGLRRRMGFVVPGRDTVDRTRIYVLRT
jgi:hypothetical protein